MVVSHVNICTRCGAEIETGQRWVREKVYEPALAGLEPQYRRYHAELFDGQQLSCWERHLLQADSGRLAA
jgi:NMD protein affecting ribosome stability and mRNA decay